MVGDRGQNLREKPSKDAALHRQQHIWPQTQPQARPSAPAPWEGETQPCLTQLSKVATQTAPMYLSRPTEAP